MGWREDPSEQNKSIWSEVLHFTTYLKFAKNDAQRRYARNRGPPNVLVSEFHLQHVISTATFGIISDGMSCEPQGVRFAALTYTNAWR